MVVCTRCFAVTRGALKTGPLGYVLWSIFAGLVVGTCAFMNQMGEVTVGTLIVAAFVLILGMTIASQYSKVAVCASCGSRELVPPDSPRGMDIMRQHPPQITQPSK